MKKEFAIGETFQYGLAKLKCVKAPYKYQSDNCYQCALYYGWEDMCLRQGFVGECDGIEREDKTDVIFVKVED